MPTSPYTRAVYAACAQPVATGELINIEYEAGVMHARCSAGNET